MTPEPTARHRVLGVRIDRVTPDELFERVGVAVRTRRTFLAVSQNLHSVYLAQSDATLRRVQEAADVVRIDGMPLVWAARAFGYPVERRHRSGWMDLMDPFCRAAAASGWSVFYLGSRDGVAEAGAQELRRRHPGLRIVTHHGYVDTAVGSPGALALLDAIASARPDVLMVGMGMPRQERWIADHRASLDVPVVLTCGAAIDYVAGVVPTPPRWLGRLGVEWLYRLLAEPRRLWRRYLIEPWVVLAVLVRDVVHRVRGRGPYVAG